MYRGITLSPVLSKVSESVLLRLYDEFLGTDPLQFGFKKNSSCNHALFTLTETVESFTSKSTVLGCTVLYSTQTRQLTRFCIMVCFKKTVEKRSILCGSVCASSYSCLRCCVKWNNVVGEFFSLFCAVSVRVVFCHHTYSVCTSVGRYHGTTVEPRYLFFTVPVPSGVTVLPWYRNTTNTAVLPYGTCQQIVNSAKKLVRKKTVYFLG